MKKDSSRYKLLFLPAVLVLVPVIFVSAQMGDPASSSASGAAPTATDTPVSIPTVTPAAATAGNSASATPSLITPRATPRATPASIPASVSPSVVPAGSKNAPPQNSSPDNTLIAIVSAAVLGALGFLGFSLMNKGAQEKNREKDDNRCDNIKELLDQKKKELEDMVRGWPEEKVKQMATDRVLGELKKDEGVRKVLDVAEDVKDKYDTLTATIEKLQQKYDLCMLGLPSAKGPAYNGTIVKNSLNDESFLKNVEVKKTYQMEDWLLHDVVVNEGQIEKLGQYLKDGPWYMHFWQPDKDDVIIVFKDKNFNIKYSDKATWTEALQYGRSKGIPEEQLDFSVR